MTPSDPAAYARASVPLSLLLDAADYAVRLCAPRPSPGRPDPARDEEVRSVRLCAPVVIDLAEPGPYIMRGDLLLITGMGLPEEAALPGYVANIVDAGAAALILGLEPVFDAVPPALADACADAGLPLMSLPPEVSFGQVTAHINQALESERTRALSTMTVAAQQLTRAALQHRPAQQILSVLGRTGTGWALLREGGETSGAGRVPDGVEPSQVMDALEERLAGTRHQRRRGDSPTVRSLLRAGEAEHEVLAVDVEGGARAGEAGAPSILAVARAPRITVADHTTLLLAANLLKLVMSLPTEQSASLDQLTMHLLTDAAPAAAARHESSRFASLLASSLGDRRSRTAYATVAVRHPGAPAAVAAAETGWLRRLLRTPFVDHRRDRLRAYTTTPPGPAALRTAAGLGWCLATSEEHELADLPDAMAQAEELARTARHVGEHVLGHRPRGLDRAWTAAAGASARDAAVARLLLDPVGADDAEVRRALRTWLRENGSWDRAARTLGIHRNTLRRLVGEAERLLERDLGDPLERARLVLAFAAVDGE